ncbi:MAG: hypothetical protein M0Z85_09460 [Gammaproteobacteria bacterium]|nr:hypothetical protein [Gammaproteobacteria bacterium]
MVGHIKAVSGIPTTIIEAIIAYGDARADGDIAQGAERLAACIAAILEALPEHPPECSENPLGKRVDLLAAFKGPPPSDRELIGGLLQSAGQIMQENQDGSRDGSVAWRLADAGLLLRRVLEADQSCDVAGFDIFTGRGALLPSEKPSKQRGESDEP